MQPLVIIASSTASVRKRWRQALNRDYAIHEVASYATLRRSMANRRPVVLLLDLSLANLGGIKSIAALQDVSPFTEIVLLTRNPNDKEGVAVLKAGAKGYCHKGIDGALLRKAVELIQRGETWVGRKIIPHLLKELTSATARPPKESSPNPEKNLESLTPREREVAQLVGNGDSNKEIASQLNITERTVKEHLSAIFRKLGVSDRLRLAIYVIDHLRQSG